MTAGRTSYVIAVLDANVLYSAPLRDFFMWQAELPDSDDRHVLAAAIECDAAYIVTENLDDFPDEALISTPKTPATWAPATRDAGLQTRKI